MEEKQSYKIIPIITNEKEMYKFYEFVLNIGYEIKVFDKKKDSHIYKYFLPVIRDYLFWTFNLKDVDKFKKMNKEMQAAVCNNYSCTIFEKEDMLIVAFNTGIIFIIGNNAKEAEKIKKYEGLLDISKININPDKVYKADVQEIEYLYIYIITLYKYVMLNKLDKAMENKESFDKNRNEFVKFVQGIYSKKITENLSGNKMENDWEQKLGLDKLYISVENKFDILYRNIKLDNHNTMFRIIIILLVVLIIIGTINLGNYLM